jgi:hypothetical protein
LIGWPPVAQAAAVRRIQTAEQRRGLERAKVRSAELRRAGAADVRSGAELLASLKENEGWLTPESSPHVFFLAAALDGRIS